MAWDLEVKKIPTVSPKEIDTESWTQNHIQERKLLVSLETWFSLHVPTPTPCLFPVGSKRQRIRSGPEDSHVGLPQVGICPAGHLRAPQKLGCL